MYAFEELRRRTFALGHLLSAFVAFIVESMLALVPASGRLPFNECLRFAHTVPFAPIDPALQNEMRHEAGMPRRSAARHI